MDNDKTKIVYENKKKSGIYRITNLTNKKFYIGSSLDLGRRFTTYYSFSFIDRRKTSLICKALLKYGYSKFSLEVLEYCSKENLLNREQYYLDLLKPEYNILTTAGSSLGYKHKEETIAKFKTRQHTEETKAKIKSWSFTPEIGEKISISKGTKVIVCDVLTNKNYEYNSIRKVAVGLNAPNSTIRYYAMNNKIYKNRYKFKLIKG